MSITNNKYVTENHDSKTHTTKSRSALLVALLACILVVTACRGSEVVIGDLASPSDNSSDSAALDGQRFWSTSVRENGEEKPLVDGTRIYLQITGDMLAASGGCNTISGPYRLNDNQQLTFPDGLFATEIGCDPQLHAQDDFVEAMLNAQPLATRSGDVLVLTTDTVTIEFIDQSVADPDRSITNTRWTVGGFIDGEFAMTMSVDPKLQGWIELSEDLQLRGFDGCVEFNTPATLTENGTASASDAGGTAGSDGGNDAGGDADSDGGGEVTVAGDDVSVESTDTGTGNGNTNVLDLIDTDGMIWFNELTFGECDELPEYSERFRAAFNTGNTVFAIDGPRLTLLNAQGKGIDFVADE